jgi:inhibitor of KinA sporulation pathway (predicted exonuclease)
VAAELSAFILENNCFVNPVTWGAGDSAELLTEFHQRDIPFPHFGRRWIDVKTVYSFLQLAKGTNPSGGLSSAMGRMKLQFRGPAHRAEVDAFNTLRFWFHLMERQTSFDAMLTLAKGLA